MKCCGSPTTSTAASAAAPPAAVTADKALQALLFAEILKPLAPAFGPLGDVMTTSLAQTVALGRRP